MNKIIFFDIDGTLFNAGRFLDELYLKLEAVAQASDKSTFMNIYQKVKNDDGYFIPDNFISSVSNEFNIPQAILIDIFWNPVLFKNCVYEDASEIKHLSSVAELGIFSRGDKKFQEFKLKFIGDFPQENTFIFPNKSAKAQEVIEKYPDYDLIFVDNDANVLSEEKKINTKIRAVLIDREDNLEDNGEVTKITDLEQIKDLI